MKLKVYNESKEIIEQPIRLKLNQIDEAIRLDVVSEEGYVENNLLTIRSDGTVLLSCSIDRSYGFKLDEEGQLDVIKAYD